MCITLSITTRTARKPHTCIWCGEAIPVGTTYVERRGVNDESGTLDTDRYHHECEVALLECAAEERGCYYFGAYEHKRGSAEEA